jgi:uncharacterized protein YqgV (UPF0045/DUF77 family)
MNADSTVNMEPCRLEFLIEPFAEGKPGPHVLRSLAVLRQAGLEVVLGPFGNTVEGDEGTLTAVLPTIAAAAFENGATRLLLNMTKGDAQGSAMLGHDQQAIPAVRSDAAEGPPAIDGPMAWKETVIDPSRREDLHGAVDRMINAVEDLMGGHLGDLSREKKQAAVRIMDEQGVFLIRKSVETVAKAMGVSRITIYNYLNAIRGD